MKKTVKIMGIVNITDDSYYCASRVNTREQLLEKIVTHLEEGADIIDIGACSTRPGSKPISSEEEWARLKPALRIYRELFPNVPLSIDTFRAPIVQHCFDEIGPFMVNDISAGEADSRMLPIVGKLGLSYIAMHKRGTPETMQSMCQYRNVVKEVVQYFRNFEHRAADAGISNWIVDPGFGFAKTPEQNFRLLAHLDKFRPLHKEIMVGISRKSFIYAPLGLTPEEALPPTTVLHRIAIENGANILRVHDVAPVKAIV